MLPADLPEVSDTVDRLDRLAERWYVPRSIKALLKDAVRLMIHLNADNHRPRGSVVTIGSETFLAFNIDEFTDSRAIVAEIRSRYPGFEFNAFGVNGIHQYIWARSPNEVRDVAGLLTDESLKRFPLNSELRLRFFGVKEAA